MAEEKDDFNYQEDVKNANLKDIIAETENKETNPAPETADTPKEAETKADEPVDQDKLRAELKAELDAEYKEREAQLLERAKTETTAEIFNRLNPNATKEETDEFLANAPWVKENRDPTYKEALKYMKDGTKEELKAEILADLNKEVEDEDVKTKTAEEEAQKAQEATNTAYNTYWDNQLKDLETKGYLPPVKDVADLNDPGTKARIELFTKMAEVNKDKPQAQQNFSLKDIYLDHFIGDKNLGKRQPAGADAPIAGARKSVSGNADKDFSYNEMHKASIYDILAGK